MTKHLTEAERHGLADGTLAPDVDADVAEHLGACTECAADVARIKSLMTRTREMPSWLTEDAQHADDLWPGIRARIEQDKVAPLRDLPARTVGARRRLVWTVSGIAAAAMIASAVLLRRNASSEPALNVLAPGTTLTAVAESTQVYEEQARFLLNELELRRAMLRPQTAASIDHDLQVLDTAIAELKRAIERDPRNMALRALLASSYKQKVDLLKRVGNAG